LAGAHNTSWSYHWLTPFMGGSVYDYCNFLAGVIIVYSILMSKQLSEKLDRRVLIWLGKLSFSVYLIHLIVLYVVGLPIFNMLLNQGWSFETSAVCASVVFIGMTLFFAAFYSRWVDQLAIQVSQKIANKF